MATKSSALFPLIHIKMTDSAPIHEVQFNDNNSFVPLQTCQSQLVLESVDNFATNKRHLPSPNQKQYMCFKCNQSKYKSTSNPNRQNGYHDNKRCEVCSGSQMISDKHPMALLLQQVLIQSLPNLKQNKIDQLTSICRQKYIEKEYGCQNPIKQQSFSLLDDGHAFCSCCKRQYQIFNSYNCLFCTKYQICSQCFNTKRYTHPHPLTSTRPNNKIMVSPPNMKKISQITDGSVAMAEDDLCHPICDHCNEIIEQCYQNCLTCHNSGGRFNICANCSKENQYNHDVTHQLAFKFLKSKTSLSRMDSETDKEEDDRANKSRHNTQKSLVCIEDFDNSLDESLYNREQNKNSPQKHEAIILKASSNILQESNELKFLQIDSPTLKSKLSKSYNHAQSNEQDEQQKKDTVDFETTSTRKATNGRSNLFDNIKQYKPMVKTVDAARHSTSYNSRFSQRDISKTCKPSNPQEPYRFSGYQCDICKVNPIENSRFHCKQCPDFDLCSKCFNNNRGGHLHLLFQEINGLKLKQQRQMLLKSKQIKLKDFNRLKYTTYFRNSTKS